jgi:prepilin-type processing-associated H-X9-DG protein
MKEPAGNPISVQFRLQMLALLFVVLLTSLAVFGGWGIGVFVVVGLLAIYRAGPWYLALLLCLLLLFALLEPAVVESRQFSRSMTCRNNLKQIALALHNYAHVNKCLPPAYITDKNGKPMHSWRVLILPYLEEDGPYKQYNFNEPWDGPNNKKLLGNRPQIYVCPNSEEARKQGETCTSYVAIVGSNAAWPGKKPKRPEDIDSGGGLSNTILVAETADVGIPWTKPEDLSLKALSSDESPSIVAISSKLSPDDTFSNRFFLFFVYPCRAGANVAMADGSVTFLPGGMLASKKLPDVLKIGGFREEYSRASWATERLRIHWLHCIIFAVWVASSGWLLVQTARSRNKPIASAVE